MVSAKTYTCKVVFGLDGKRTLGDLLQDIEVNI